MKRRQQSGGSTEKMFEDFFGFGKPRAPEPEPAPVVPVVPTRPSAPAAPIDPPADWNPAVYMDCGHWQIQFIPRPLPPGENAYTSKGPSQISVVVETPEECHYCRTGVPGHPQYQTEAYRKPVPKGMRRTLEREAGQGWPGYCCDDEGFYIGGIANLCLTNPDGRRCVVHRPRPRGSNGREPA